MSGENWTKGPWRVDGHGLRAIVRGANAVIVVIRHRLDAEVHEANSHLIAAAPEMDEVITALL